MFVGVLHTDFNTLKFIVQTVREIMCIQTSHQKYLSPRNLK